MITIRKSEERGHANHGWLNSYHTFSFANYYDPKFMGFRSLRVINEDRVAPGKGFGSHQHQDMEILSYVLDGKLAHKDSMGHQEVLGPNEIQRMSAGSGVVHSEFNASPTEPVHFLQIWIEPSSDGVPASYEQIAFAPSEKRNKLRLLAGKDGGEGAATINQDAYVYLTHLEDGERVTHRLDAARHAWVHVVKGSATVNGLALQTGDAAAISAESEIAIGTGKDESAELLIFDLA